MKLTEKELLLLLGMVENVGNRLEIAGLKENELDSLMELDYYNISDSCDFSIPKRRRIEDEVLFKVAKMILESEQEEEK